MLIRSNSDSNFFKHKYYVDSLKKNFETLEDFTGEKKKIRRKYSKKATKAIIFEEEDKKDAPCLNKEFNMQMFLIKIWNLVKVSGLYFRDKVMKNLKSQVILFILNFRLTIIYTLLIIYI